MDPKKIDEIDELMLDIIKSLQNELKELKETPKEAEEDDSEDESFEESFAEVKSPMDFERVLSVLKIAKKLYNMEFVFWTDSETHKDLGRKLYCFGYVNDHPDHIVSFYEKTPSNCSLTEFKGSAILQQWFIEELEN